MKWWFILKKGVRKMNYNKITDFSKQITENKSKNIHMLIDLKYDIKFIVNDEQYIKIEKLIDEAIKRIEEGK